MRPAAAAPPLDVMPAPAEVHIAGGLIPVRDLLVVGTSDGSDRGVAGAVARLESRWLGLRSKNPDGDTASTGYKLTVNCVGKGSRDPFTG